MQLKMNPLLVIFISSLFYLFQFQVVNARSLTGSNTLVLYDDRLIDLDDYSKFFESLKDRSFQLQFQDLSSKQSQLDSNWIEKYNNLIIFPIKGKHINRQLSVDSLLNFYENKIGNILTMTTPDGVPDSVRLFLNQLGIYPSPKGQALTDYFQASSSSSSSSNLVIPSSNLALTNNYIYQDYNEQFQFGSRVSVAILDNRDLIIPVLRSTRTSFDKGPMKTSWSNGSQNYLIVSFQNLQNNRLSWIGSIEFLNDSNFDMESNESLIKELTKWTFNEKSIVKIASLGHAHSNGISYDDLKYKVNDEIIFNLTLTEWDDHQQKWTPFLADDIQLELKQVDPYYRLNLKKDEMVVFNDNVSGQLYSTGPFKLPTRHGVFTFSVEYERSGLSFFKVEDVKSIRHLANDEYPRSWEITNAWVYLTSIYSVIGAWIIFIITFLTTSSSSPSSSSVASASAPTVVTTTTTTKVEKKVTKKLTSGSKVTETK
ncbi:dolichyl-diphosphooligosaccharide-protein glycotransferase NDAI_0A08260 [Naumovozyma dairenensis CBS 421]|uniref:Dolichyl-diphosphooligosaccharide--protein glycosyltransferase subunit WBP1 n=1 Tax=Naumovozyma dairenensis (strain ATCC 10597 / BCRC 20456 / CBS 421 / NBRC 0211 / NRRL Y-12639) TaxID=1071378 RepID=G0W591_NAUDC|nr:hypothetical protein NDAI_0A08260 [Naumovozyma dairenensis CBS 421]CCD22979.1 hypothetical protein NDAI_0A08260 [Naumovozyma dairenensis CBS 421]